ncbi:Sulphatase-modifying factor protein [[Leptolyngbya] sp. PCC 7376]|uniref:formylglycine-generating enzyme family protein n=1 Tax=[Leptolyngbya] sp. PCC 7376 TaxID=111781 RepID=UPI00029F45B0|nr:formylglycine-generating enzyme family protein [[Leptolyngbya] sp. PCC 7376]AFY40265.1 Sulphatase-modifying factor protein [[Leptolyngbya] sp. PCC 7376]
MLQLRLNHPEQESPAISKSLEFRDELPQSFTEDLGDGVKLDMIRIPKGSFMMGSSDAGVNEYPQHQVEITEAFYLGQYLVTQSQYEAVMGINPSKFKKGGFHPVERVSWDDAQAFCQKLSEQSGRKYRLLSEAEWEYACRAGADTQYSFGDELTKQQGNLMQGYVADVAITVAKWLIPGLAGTTEVGQYPPNDFGLYDMHGNVQEWCEDSWEDNYETPRNQTPVTNSSELRVLRGGAWDFISWGCRSAFRDTHAQDDKSDAIGFRIACSSTAMA